LTAPGVAVKNTVLRPPIIIRTLCKTIELVVEDGRARGTIGTAGREAGIGQEHRRHERPVSAGSGNGIPHLAIAAGAHSREDKLIVECNNGRAVRERYLAKLQLRAKRGAVCGRDVVQLPAAIINDPNQIIVDECIRCSTECQLLAIVCELYDL
jgi:hypothetical protein